MTRELPGVRYLITNEAGASVYSASPQRALKCPTWMSPSAGQSPLPAACRIRWLSWSKIDPRSIGVGMYQHDVDQTALTGALTAVVEDVVNRVGVDVNTASAALLTYVSGIGAKLADKMVAYRDEKGGFSDREAIRNVPGLGPKAFEQSAGFLRVREGHNVLHASAIHPESYAIAEIILKYAGTRADADLEERRKVIGALQATPAEELAEEDRLRRTPPWWTFSSSLSAPGAIRAKTPLRPSCARTCSRWKISQ